MEPPARAGSREQVNEGAGVRPAVDQPGGTSSRATVAAMVGLAGAVRLWLLTRPALELDADEAVTGIMARRILDGHHTAYFAGQNYMGTVEQYLQAAVLALLPDSDLALRLPQVALAAVSCLLVHRIALRCGLTPRRALLAASLFAVGPYFLAYWGTKSRGGYAAAMVLGLLGLLIALSTTPEDRQRALKVAGFGLVSGMSLWVNQQAAYLLIPAALWLWASLRDRPGRHAAIGTAAALLGALPALWRTGMTGSPLLAAVGGESTPGDRISHLLRETLPHFLGVRDDEDWLLPWLPPQAAVVVALVVLAMLVVRRRRSLGAILRLRTTGRDGRDLLILVLAIIPLLAAGAGASTNAAARFLFVTYPVVIVLVAAIPVPRAVRGTWFPSAAAVLLVAAFAAHTWVGARWLIAEDDGGYPDLLGTYFTEDDADAVLAALRAAGSDVAYADYWVAQPLTWRADGDVLVEPVYQKRFAHVSAAARRASSPAFVVDADEADELMRYLDDRGVDHRILEAQEWRVFTDVTPAQHPERAPTVLDGLRWAE